MLAYLIPIAWVLLVASVTAVLAGAPSMNRKRKARR